MGASQRPTLTQRTYATEVKNMGSATMSTVGKAVAERISGSRPGGIRAFAAATVVGVATAVATYRLLRSGN